MTTVQDTDGRSRGSATAATAYALLTRAFYRPAAYGRV